MSQQAPRLADLVRTHGPLPPDAVARLLLPVADELSALHAGAACHGGVSSQAIRVDDLDRGRATLLPPDTTSPDPSFSAPEVAAGRRPDDLADVWSLAGVLFHAATGQSPYSPPLGPRDGGWLQPIIELGLLPDPGQRPTMAELAAYLRARVAPDQPGDAPGVEPEPGAPRRGVTGLWLGVAGVALIALVAVLGAGLLLAGGDEDAVEQPRASATARSSATLSSPPPAPPGSTAAAPTAPPAPTEQELEEFARSYVQTASASPERGFARLTRAYRRASPRYHEVWSAIDDPQVLAVDADPARMSVSYTYRYRLGGRVERTEDVTLHLVERGGRLLIAGATSRPR